MEKLDDYIKTILDQSEPAYNNEYWKQTALYIENKRKRRFFFYIWFSTGLLILFLGVGSIFIFNKDTQHGTEKTNQISKPISMIPEKSEEMAKISKESDQVRYNKNIQNSTDLTTASKSSKRSSNREHLNFNIKTNNTTINNIDSRSNNQDANYSPAIVIDNHSVISENYLVESNFLPTTQISSLNLLELPFRVEFNVEHGLSQINFTETKDIVQEPLHSKLSYYVDLGGILNPVINPNQKWSLGMSGGLGMNFNFKQKISFQAGISYLHRWGTFNVMIDHPTPIYDFTKDERGYTLVPTDAGYLTFPLSIGIPVGKYTFGLGINSMRLLGAKGNVFSYTGLPVENEPEKVVYRSTQVSSGWIETPGFRKWVFEYNLFMERQMNKHFNVGMRFGYLPKGLVKSDYNFYFDNESMNYIERESAGLLENNYHLTIYMTYKL